MLVALQVKLREEPRGADGDERRAGGVRPEVRREPVEGGAGEVVRDDEGIRVDKQRILLQDVCNVLQHRPAPREHAERTKRTKRPNETKVAGGARRGGEGTYVDLSSAVDTVIELGEPAGRLDGLGAADALDLEEEVVPDVLGRDVVWIEDGKVADAGQDEVLQRRGRRRRAADHEQARGLERRLACRRPEPVCGCGSVVRLYSVDFVEEGGCWAGGRGGSSRTRRLPQLAIVFLRLCIWRTSNAPHQHIPIAHKPRAIRTIAQEQTSLRVANRVGVKVLSFSNQTKAPPASSDSQTP